MTLQINRSKLFNDFFEKSTARNVKYLVLHHIQDDSLEKAIKELRKHRVSSHYMIDEDGEVFCLVEENDIAYHAGISYWKGKFNLNHESIGIEFLSSDPYKKGFNEKQIKSGIELCNYVIKKHNIKEKNIVGHSDIAYDKESGLLDRKDDPSDLFPWHILAQNKIGIWPTDNIKDKEDKVLFQINDKDEKITNIKKQLSDFGYKVNNLDDGFDQELANLVTVFNRRFNPNKYKEYKGKWLKSSSKILEAIS